jgi:hypothetical protein
MLQPMQHDRFHGRHSGAGRYCDWAGCGEAGEFRAPAGGPAAGFDGPGSYRWFCLDHVREFNARYDFFRGMSRDEILDAQSPLHGWSTETRAFRPTGGIDSPPRWADFTDPLDAIAARARWRAGERKRAQNPPQREDGVTLNMEERRALEALGLSVNADRRDLRRRYSELVRLYHPDRNGGDRSHEANLQRVVEAYQLLRKAQAFA